MKRRNGFTLIELLAVIVILAVIVLIATPTILGVIDNAKMGAVKSSALGYIDAIEKTIAINMLDSSKENIADRTYSVEELKELGVTIKGTLPTGNVVISKGQVTDYILGIDGYVIENGTVTKVTNTKKYDNGYVVYYDPTTGESCDTYQEANSLNETKNGCMKWYIYNDEEGNATVNMILDHNTTARLAWNTVGTYGTNVSYEESNIKPEVDKLVSESNWKASPRLITAEEVNKITGMTEWTNTSGWYCLESKMKDYVTSPYCNNTGTIGWLYDYTYCVAGSNDWKCNNNDNSTFGYWTSTTYGIVGSGSFVWRVSRLGDLRNNSANYADIGIRPVITISKSIIS